MTKSYYLTVEVKSASIANGLGYMIAFSIPEGANSPDELGTFEAWRDDVRQIVLQAGDLCLHPDLYTKKLAIVGLMHDLAELNKRHDVQIGFLSVPAVQICSTNPFDDTLMLDFTDREGHYKIEEIGINDKKDVAEVEHGKTGLTDITRRHFPFQKSSGKKISSDNRPKP